MQITIPEIVTTEHEIDAETFLEALRKLVTGTLFNKDKTPSTIDVFDFMEQHKDSILTEQKVNVNEFEKTVIFAITTKILSAERITKFLDIILSWDLPLQSRYILVSMNLLDQTAFEYLAAKNVSVIDQPPALLNVFKNDKQLSYILNQVVKNPDYMKVHASDLNNLIRSTSFTAKEKEDSAKLVEVALEILKAVSDKVKNTHIRDELLIAAVKADSVLREKYFPSPPVAAKVDTPKEEAKAPTPAETPSPSPAETPKEVVAGSTIVPETPAPAAAEKVETIHERLARLEATLAQVAKALAK